MRASRLLAILILLQLRVRLTAQALADEFEVSVRTIYRDIDQLSAAGVPVYADRGPGGGFQLLDGWRTQLTGLAGDEVEAMPMLGLAGPAAALGMTGALKRAQGKLLAALPEAQRSRAGLLAARFHLDPLDWYREEGDIAHLPNLVRAVLDQRAVAISYESWTATKGHRLDPLGLVMKGGTWYLVARSRVHHRPQPATFKVANIRALTILDEAFERPPNFNLAASWQAQLDAFAMRLRPLTATVRATGEGRRKLTELGDFAAQAVRQADGGDVALPIESITQAAMLVLGLAGEVEALAPPELRARVAELAAAAVVRHGGVA